MWGSKKRKVEDLEYDLAEATKDAKFWTKRNAEKRERITELSAKLARVSKQYIEAGEKLNAALATVESQKEENAVLQTFVDEVAIENRLLHLVLNILLTEFQ